MPLRGLEALDATSNSDNNLRQSSSRRAAQRGALADNTSSAVQTAEALAAALLALPPAERARLSALLLGRQPGERRLS
jgi:hypothetical protein